MSNELCGLGQLFESTAKIIRKSDTLPSRMDTEARQTITGINRTIRGHLKIPENLKIEIWPVLKAPRELDGIIKVGRQVELSHGLKTKPQYFKVILAHEYGHAILKTNLKNNNEIKRLLDSKLVPADEYHAFQAVEQPYEEFFADLVAAMHVSDSGAIRLTLTPTGVSKSEITLANARDFGFSHRIRGWDAEGPYSRLSPSRTYLWSFLSENSERMAKDKGITLAKVVAAIKERLHQQIIELNRENFPLPGPLPRGEVEQLNAEFIKSLKHQFLGLQ